MLRGRKIGIIASEMKLPALQSKFRILNFKSALRHYIIIIYVPALTARYEGLVRADRAGRLVVRLLFSNKDLDDRQADSLRCYLRVSCFNWLIVFKKPTCTYVCSTRARVHVLYVRVHTEMAVKTLYRTTRVIGRCL